MNNAPLTDEQLYDVFGDKILSEEEINVEIERVETLLYKDKNAYEVEGPLTLTVTLAAKLLRALTEVRRLRGALDWIGREECDADPAAYARNKLGALKGGE